jgi:hypothetical protein
MKHAVVCLAIAVGVSPAFGQRRGNDTGPTERACGGAECFYERDVRAFEVVDQTHLIVFVGSQRCAFHIELRGAACDMTFAPEVWFHKLNEVPVRDTAPVVAPPGIARNPLEIERRQDSREDLRICDNDLTVQVHGGVFTETNTTSQPPDRFGNPRTDCQVSSVSPITDDQLIEFYVGRGVTAPPPPIGAAEIEVGEQEEQGAAENTDSRGRRAE